MAAGNDSLVKETDLYFDIFAIFKTLSVSNLKTE